MMGHKLQLDIFEGPLDLLLYLIKKSELDICDIPIAEVTDQYMEYIETMKVLDLEIVGEFFVMAATLMQIKSRMLLPPDPLQEEEEADPRDELVRRLREYKVFKEAADQLRDKEFERQSFYSRKIDEEGRRELKEESREVYFEANLFDLMSAFTKAIGRFQEEAVYEVSEEEFTVEQKIHDILHILLREPSVLLTDIFERATNRSEVIVLFMAILELIRLKEIKVVQKRLFADIEVMYNRDSVIPPENLENGRTQET